jgi:NAD(P)-dependent dehydrogenase (short-subunit alcohol dehydrogenase family)
VGAITFDGKIALVTGAGSGIGKAIAQFLAEGGASVAVVDVIEDAAVKAAQTMGGSGLKAEAFKCDVADSAQVNRMARLVEDAFGGIDILVNNAGIGDESAPVDEMTDQQWNRMLDVHLGGTFKVTRALVPLMKRRGGGRIVNISSQSGMVGETNFCHYCAAKAGILGLTKALAKELAPFRIAVNAVAPGVIETPYFKDYSEDQMAEKRAKVPWGRLGKPEDVAYLTAFLLSEQADYITGQVISPNGGRTIVGI